LSVSLIGTHDDINLLEVIWKLRMERHSDIRLA
jgi:hypothetical protein